MYTDLPQFTRCCFCAPLRIGLLAWGYIKLAISILIWLLICDGIMHLIDRGFVIPVGTILFIIAEIIDNIFTVILVVAAHKKHEKLFKVSYIYSIVFLVLFGVICGLHLVYMFMSMMSYPHPYVVDIFMTSFASSIASIMVQGYITLLIRSEMLKLRDRSNIQFSNLAEEAQCNAYVEKV
ncbi:uncharacterized protein LOC128674100 [Plodia interpunctella]|uniref:uncharacterized protein LOC128674100 n=1 Tax=Plodia interpunctella TaxID=58824 RepID=UPI002367F6E4|nr:uncharacterized protein LOC128674100 [Plodia interpunctella]